MPVSRRIKNLFSHKNRIFGKYLFNYFFVHVVSDLTTGQRGRELFLYFSFRFHLQSFAPLSFVALVSAWLFQCFFVRRAKPVSIQIYGTYCSNKAGKANQLENLIWSHRWFFTSFWKLRGTDFSKLNLEWSMKLLSIFTLPFSQKLHFLHGKLKTALSANIAQPVELGAHKICSTYEGTTFEWRIMLRN